MSTSTSRALVHRYYEEFLSAPGNLDAADELFTSDVVFHNPISTGIHGIEEYKAFARRWYVGFPDRKFVVDDDIAEGNKIAAKFTITGTHKGEFMGLPGTGNQIDAQIIDIVRIEGDQLVEHWGVADMAKLMQQLGMIPAP